MYDKYFDPKMEVGWAQTARENSWLVLRQCLFAGARTGSIPDLHHLSKFISEPVIFHSNCSANLELINCLYKAWQSVTRKELFQISGALQHVGILFA